MWHLVGAMGVSVTAITAIVCSLDCCSSLEVINPSSEKETPGHMAIAVSKEQGKSCHHPTPSLAGTAAKIPGKPEKFLFYEEAGSGSRPGLWCFRCPKP